MKFISKLSYVLFILTMIFGVIAVISATIMISRPDDLFFRILVLGSTSFMGVFGIAFLFITAGYIARVSDEILEIFMRELSDEGENEA